MRETSHNVDIELKNSQFLKEMQKMQISHFKAEMEKFNLRKRRPV